MRYVGRMRYFFPLFLALILISASFPCFAETLLDNLPLLFQQNPPAAWRNNPGKNAETLIRGQNRYGKYLKNYGIWGDFYGYEGRLRPKSSLFGKMRNSDIGMQFGIDLPGGEIFTSTLYYSYATPTLSVMSSPYAVFEDGELETTNHQFGLRWTSYGEGLYMLFGLNGGFDKYDFNTAQEGGLDGSGWQLGANGEFGLDVELEKWKLRPHLGFDYRWLHHDTIDGNQGVLCKSDTYNALYSNLGFRVFRPLGPILDWQTRLSWVHNYLKNEPIRVQRFGSVPGITTPTQLYLDGSLGRDWLWFGTGLNLHFGKFFNLFVDYDLLFNKYETTHTGSLMVVLSW